METRARPRPTGPTPTDGSKSLLTLSQDLIFWQGEAQRYQRAGEAERELRSIALQILAGGAADWDRVMAQAAAPMITRLGADHWYVAVTSQDDAPAVIAAAAGLAAPPDDDRCQLALELVATIADCLKNGDQPPTRSPAVTGLLSAPVSVAGVNGLSICFSWSRAISATVATRDLLRGLGELALAAFLRSRSIRSFADAAGVPLKGGR